MQPGGSVTVFHYPEAKLALELCHLKMTPLEFLDIDFLKSLFIFSIWLFMELGKKTNPLPSLLMTDCASEEYFGEENAVTAVWCWQVQLLFSSEGIKCPSTGRIDLVGSLLKRRRRNSGSAPLVSVGQL